MSLNDELSDFPVFVVDVNSDGTRKREKNEDMWEKNRKKFARNSSVAHANPHVVCTHKEGDVQSCMAYLLSTDDVSSFHDKIYTYRTAADQNNFVFKYLIAQEVKQHRPRNKENPRPRTVTKYFIRQSSGRVLSVCNATFLSITGFSPKRVNKLARSNKESGECPPERRGGARTKPKDSSTTQSMIDFIKSLQCSESHYGRGKSTRGYLNPELSIKRLWRIWKQIQKQQNKSLASYSKFFKVFQTKFNLSFGSPKTDVCSFCDLTKSQIRSSKDLREKASLTTQYRLHKLRAKKFYDLLKTTDANVIKVSFDMEQNQPLPKLRVSEVFYARQIWVYNLTFVLMQDTQDVTNTFVYTWTENQSGRGSNEVVSALKNFLGILEETYKDVPEKSLTLKLFSDACCGQNKNQNVMGFLLYYIRTSRAFNIIEHCFPIRGHSYMPPDRVFGRFEKKFRKMETITEPDEYYKVFASFATVKVLGKDWVLYDYMDAAKRVLLKKLPFLMREQRTFLYSNKSKVNVKTKTTYCGDLNTFKVVKKGCDLLNVYSSVTFMSQVNHISEKKKKDVQNLIKFITLSYKAQQFYNKALTDVKEGEEDNNILVYDELEPFI